MDCTACQTSEAVQADIEPESIPEKISAYYSLVFPNFTYYLQTLSVTIGRRCIPSTGSSSDPSPVDVDLGSLKSVSRLHARIEYEEEEERFVLVVIGRNGAWVDGVWSGSGSRVFLSERSQIQIASRTFHFVLPPPPAPEDSPSPSSQSSYHNARSPSVDITSISPPSSMPSHSPPPTNIPRPPHKVSRLYDPKSNVKKRKKSIQPPPPQPIPKPEVVPLKPPLTYAQLCYRAIKAFGGKATLQDINKWIVDTYDWYKYNCGGWKSSVRHNLSSNHAFKKLERCPDARRKVFYWSIDEAYEQAFVDQEARIQPGKGLDGETGKSKKKEKGGVSVLEPPLKRSVKGDAKGGPLPPPLTSTPLPPRKYAPFCPIPRPLSLHESASSHVAVASSLEPGSADSQLPHSNTSTGGFTASASTSLSANNPTGGSPAAERGSIPPLPPSLFIPIVVGPIPASHSSSPLPTDSNTNPLASNAIVLHDSTLILNPEVFSHLTPAQVKELESLGAQKALEILQGYIARYLKEQRLKNRMSVRGRGRGRNTPRRGRGGSVKAGDSAPATGEGSPAVDLSPEGKPAMVDSGPLTTVPLPHRDVQPRLNGDVAIKPTSRTMRSPARAVVPTCVDAKPPDSVSVADPGSASCDSTDPIIVVDDSDSSDSPVAKRRKLDDSAVPPICRWP